jgi:hypothetical protein
MIQLRLTEKLRKEFGISPSSLIEPTECHEGLGSWTLNLFKVRNQKAIIFVNDKTLYSFIIYKIRKDKFFNLVVYFVNGFTQLLEFDGFNEQEINHLTKGCNKICFTKTYSKSVLGNVNDLVWHYQMHVLDYGDFKHADVGNIIYKLNRMPQKNIGWSYSIDVVKKIATNVDYSYH